MAKRDTNEPKADANIHKNHRQRLRERYEKSTFDSFSPHEILEFLLCYAIPRQDVNPLAHRLIDRFGSLSAVLDAPTEELKTVDGMGDVSAQFLHMLPQLAKVYLKDKQTDVKSFHKLIDIKHYLQPRFVGADHEMLYLLLFDNGMHMLYSGVIAEGEINKVDVPSRKIANLALQYRATAAVLAHNHPHGLSFPSQEDQVTTTRICQILNELDVTLIEHFIFDENSCVPMLLHDKTIYRSSQNSTFDRAFYQNFYASVIAYNDYNEFDMDTTPVVLPNDLLETMFEEEEK